jgi:LPXTG-site transpeptidase (sortase) family protein
VHLVIASIGVDAPVEVIGINADGVMETPGSPTNVGWYDFSAHPGEVGNIVFAGHVDYHDYGEAVFWYLDTIQLGDIIDVQTDDDRTVSYRVTKLENFSGDVDARTITAATSTPTITLITCEGDFDPSTRSYDKRLVVVGELVSK